MWSTLLAILMIVTAIVLIFLVLIQRGRGGGLAGAFGGLGGQSAFGTKAGDLFTRITIGVAAFWIILCVVTIKVMGKASDQFDSSLGRNATTSTPSGGQTSAGSGTKSNTAGTEPDNSAASGGAKSTGDSKSGTEPSATPGTDAASTTSSTEKSGSSK